MTNESSTGFTPENVFKALMTLKDATEMGFARVEADTNALGTSLGGKIDNLERRLIRIDDRLSAIENQNVAAKLANHEWRITRLEGC